MSDCRVGKNFIGIWLWITMPPRCKLNILDRGRALAWLNDGLSMQEVARHPQVSHSVIQWLQEHFCVSDRQTERSCSGCPCCTSRQDDHFQCISTLHNWSITSNTKRRQVMNAVHINTKASTIRSKLHDAGLHSRSAAVRIPLTLPYQCSMILVPTVLNHAALVQIPPHRWVSLHCCLQPQQETRLAQGRRVLHLRRFWGGRQIWRQITNGAGQHPLQWQNTPLHLTGLLHWPTLHRRDHAPPRPTCSASRETRYHFAGWQCNSLEDRSSQTSCSSRRSPGWTGPPNLLMPIEHVWDVLGQQVAENYPLPVEVNQPTHFSQQEWHNVPQQTLRHNMLSMDQRYLTSCS